MPYRTTQEIKDREQRALERKEFNAFSHPQKVAKIRPNGIFSRLHKLPPHPQYAYEFLLCEIGKYMDPKAPKTKENLQLTARHMTEMTDYYNYYEPKCKIEIEQSDKLQHVAKAFGLKPVSAMLYVKPLAIWRILLFILLQLQQLSRE